MKKHIKKIISVIIFLLVSVIAVKYWIELQNKYEQKIAPPVLAKDIPFETYSFDADSGIVIQRASGTNIKIDPGSFSDSAGKKVTGKINLLVREFHDAEALFYSGIPMSIDSRRKGFLQSAGMIELRAFSNDKKINLTSGKTATIDLASFKGAKDHQLFYLKEDQNWTSTDTFTNSINLRKNKELDELQNKYNYHKQDLYLDLVTNLEYAPYLKPFKNLQWKVAAKDVDDALMDAMRVNWDDVKVIPPRGLNRKYTLVFTEKTRSYEDTGYLRTYSMKAVPISSGKRVSQGQMLSLIDEKDKILALMEEEKKRIERQADLVNSFKIDRMGVWNIDKVMNSEDMIWAEVGFDFEKELDPDIHKITIYLMFLDDNSVIQYLPKDWKRVGFKKNSRMKIRAVLPGARVVEVDNEQIKKNIDKKGKIYLTTKRI